jgi:hypothetical protein
MKKIFFILFIFSIVNCSRKEDNFNLSISNHNYKLDLKTGEIKIDWYGNYKDTIRFSKNENEKINGLIYKYHIDTLKGESYVFGKEKLIMPNFTDEITLKKENQFKSKIYISTQVNLYKSKLNKREIDIFRFKQELFKLLYENKEYKRNMDTLEIAKKSDRRLFL